MSIRVLCEYGDNSSFLPEFYDTVEEAEEAGRAWKASVTARDPVVGAACSWETVFDLRSRHKALVEDYRKGNCDFKPLLPPT